MRRTIRDSSIAALAGLTVHYLVCQLWGFPLWTEAIAEWIMARTPNNYALWTLDTFGAWAKPFAVTGGLAALGFGLWVARSMPQPWTFLVAAVVAAGMGWLFGYSSLTGQLSFWVPAALALFALTRGKPARQVPERRAFLSTTGRFALPAVMMSGTAGVAIESFLRNQALARGAVEPVELFPFQPPQETFGPGLVRKAVTPVGEFYGMSKNTVDPAIDPRTWRLRIMVDGRPLREFRYSELLSLPRLQRYVTLRCVSNTLKSNLMGNALWSGIRLEQLVDRAALPAGLIELAVIGVDGHGDSLPLDYAFSGEVMLALGMNGKTLNRTHGFPIRLLAPRYYGFKHVKWIDRIEFRSRPYIGTWPKMGYTTEPVIHTVSLIDRVRRRGDRLHIGGVAFAGDRGIRRVELRAEQQPWREAKIEPALSPYTWSRWIGRIDAPEVRTVEARALDGHGRWQADEEGPLFPDGVKGPTIRRIS